MKTAEEARQEAATINGYANWNQMMNSNELTDRAKTGIVDICMRNYAYLIAEQVLKDACINAMEAYQQSGMTNLAERAGKAITSTPIVTP